ncbi:MAG: hypothetical protein Kow0062_24860 [Acidobacteriota bacterium]
MSAIESQTIVTAPRPAGSDPLALLEPIDRSDLEAYEAAITRMAVDEAACREAEPVAVTFRGRRLLLVPLDLPRFNRAVAAHLSLN